MHSKAGEEIPVRFEVVKIRKRFEDTGYTIFQGKFTDYPSDFLPTSEIVIAGNFPSIFEEDEFEGVGSWKHHSIYGYSFALQWAKRNIPQSTKGIQEFIKRSVKGIGAKTAERIVQTFGLETLSIIEKDWKNLLKVHGLGERKAKKIHEKISTHKKYEEVAMYVLNNGVGYKTALRVYEAFGDSAVLKIKENPYAICMIPKLGFQDADKFAKTEGVPFNDPERVKAGIQFYLEWRLKKNGDLYVDQRDLQKHLNKFLMDYGSYKINSPTATISFKQMEDCIRMLAKDEKVVAEEDEAGSVALYTKPYHIIENQIVRHLKKLIEEPRSPIASESEILDFLARYEAKYKFTLAKNQKKAVLMALSKGMSILTGGPGTGKTQTINVILAAIREFTPDATIHLCAPTGKASKRMTELTGMDAMTIHRKIGLNAFDENNMSMMVAGDFIIIDESSMIDAYVFYKLLESIDSNMRILFVGDYEQLPSVGAGLILRDLINSKRIPTTILDEIFRQAKKSQIVMNSHKIIRGVKSTDEDSLTFDESKGDFYFIEEQNKRRVQMYILQTVDKLVRKKGFNLKDIQVLSPMKKGDLGVWELNRQMQQRFNPSVPSKNEVKLDEISVLREGDRIIQTVNNYDLEVFNGEMGYITSIGTDENGAITVEVDFDDKTIVYDELAMDDLELAWVISIHKSQGSEFPIVVMPVHPSQQNMLNRNLIYTAWTRAKQKVFNVGVLSALDVAVDKTDSTIRNSKIKDKIIDQIKVA